MIDHYPYKRRSTLGTMNLSHLISRDNWTFQSQERRCHVTTLNLGPSFSVEKIKCPDPRAKVLDQTSHLGDGLRRQIPTPCPHSPPTGFTLIGALHEAEAEFKYIGILENSV